MSQHFSISTIEMKPFPAMPPRVVELEQVLELAPGYTTLPAATKEWFYWTNYSRQRPRAFWDSVVIPVLKTYPNLSTSFSASLKQDLYKASSVPLLVPSKVLQDLASGHANDLANKKAKPSHNSTNGETFQQRMVKAGVNTCAAENLSFGPANTVLALVLLYIDEGLNDLGHRKNLMNASFSNMGLGMSKFPNELLMVVQDFACQKVR